MVQRRWWTPALFFLVASCASLPRDPPRVPSSALHGTETTRLGRAVASRAADHPGLAGILALPNGREAFAARLLLIRAADRSVDLQYYIWHNDTTGRLLLEAASQAAARGVRVRLLLDDANARRIDATLADFAAQPNVEVRLFNPFANRSLAAWEAVSDFARINRRMHNKALIADNLVAIVGGRNVGDEYFEAGAGVGFADLDVAAVGPLVRETSDQFDRYWNSPSAYPATAILAPAPPGAETRLRADWDAAWESARKEGYDQAVRETPIVRDLLGGTLALEWCRAQVLADDPGKVLQPASETEPDLLVRIDAALGKAAREMDLVSPYFVPGKEGAAAFTRLAARGVRVRVLTNSLSATDVAPVHAGYSKYREELLRGGVRLFELKPDALAAGKKSSGAFGSSSSSLHAKTFGVDRERVFVGSFNLDPRSARLNTEMGAVIESRALAGRLGTFFDAAVLEQAYEVRLAPGGADLEWVERRGGAEIVHGTEPLSGSMRRLWVRFLSVLPIEWLL